MLEAAFKRALFVDATKREDEERLKQQDETKKLRRDGMAPKSLLEKPKSRTLAAIPADFPVTKCDPGKAQGLEEQTIKAKSKAGMVTTDKLESRQGRPTKASLRLQLEAMKGSISPTMYNLAKARLGLK